MGALQTHLFLLLIIHNMKDTITGATTEITFHILEEQSEEIFIGSLIEELFFPGPVQFLLLDNSEYFHLEPQTGNLYTTKKRLDREAICPFEVLDHCVITMDVFVSSEDHAEITKVNVNIGDINDNAPYFTENIITLYISEDTEMWTLFPIDHTAIDADTGKNSDLIYRLNSTNDVFTLYQHDELISLAVSKPLDRESQSTYKMSLVAYDSGSPTLSGSAALIVHVKDINDNCPIILTNNISIRIPRNVTVNSTVTQILAFDPDTGENSAINYVYGNRVQESSKNLFSLEGTSGIITLSSPVNKETNLIHKLTVLAVGPGCAPAVALVTVTIEEVRRREPKMEFRFIGTQENRVLSIREDTPPNTIIAILEMTDPDHSICRPLYISGTSPFLLKPSENSPDTYLLLAFKQLDFELEQKYDIHIIGNSTFEESRVYEEVLSITIEDVNDNVPQFPLDIIDIYIEENNRPGEILFKVSASDADSGPNGNINYILEEEATYIFAINSSSGSLTTYVSFDREREKSYTFLVTAIDQGTPSKNNSCTIIIHILDKNDNAPRFCSNEFTFFIPENLAKHGEVGIINVTDVDLGSNSEFSLSLMNFNSLFSVGQDRILRSQDSFDYETKMLYEVWIEAKDNGNPPLSSRAKIYVHIMDVNDNAPLILSPKSNFSYVLVTPDILKGSCITNVHAVDYDAGMNGVITYSEYGESDPNFNLFKIDTFTGNITLKETANITPCGLYQLLVKASDQGYPKSLFTIVRVNILLNYSISNESYLESLIMAKPSTFKLNPVIKIIPCPQYETMPLFSWALTSPAVLVIVIVFVFGCATGTFLFFCIRKRNSKRKKRPDVQIPLKLTAEYCVKDWNEVKH
ncbi:protocadherin-20-like [Pelobates fuscus]|uniref:protocadherin-20-like n=1 Tax=Pelobates fuscus TaxID=191477 RepID=UPI002FE4CB96